MTKKLVLAALVAALVMGASLAQATPSRLDTLGQGTGLVYLQDDTNVFTNPAALGYYRNVLLFHLGGVDEKSNGQDFFALGGGALALGDMLTLGLIVGRNPTYEEGIIGVPVNGAIDSYVGVPYGPQHFAYNWADYLGTNIVDLTGIADDNHAMVWMNPIDVLLAAKIGNIQLGVSYYIANGKYTASYNDDTPIDVEEKDKALLQAWKFGLSAEMGSIMPELYFHYAPFRVTSKFTDDVADTELTQELKGRRFNLGTRVFIKLNDNLTVVPAFEWANINANMTLDASPNIAGIVATIPALTVEDLSENWKGNTINAGLGINYSIEKLLVATSIGVQWSKFTHTLEVDGIDGNTEEIAKWTAFPVVGLGMEYQATKLITFRGGISTTAIWDKSTSELNADTPGSLNSEETESSTVQSTRASVGLGLNFGNMIVDLTVGGMLIGNEPNPSGLGVQNIFSALDAKYKF